MYITKLGHCCLLIETSSGKKVLTDPGAWTADVVAELQTNVDIILITHEHADHLHVPSVQAILSVNVSAQVVCNSAVAALLAKEGMQAAVCEGSGQADIAGVALHAHDARHEEIYEEIGQVPNTGYFIDNTLFYPGDALPREGAVQKTGVFANKIDILALPVAGPWCHIRDAIHFALTVEPRVAFPVHEGMLALDRVGFTHGVPGKVLPQHNIQWHVLQSGERVDI